MTVQRDSQDASVPAKNQRAAAISWVRTKFTMASTPLERWRAATAQLLQRVNLFTAVGLSFAVSIVIAIAAYFLLRSILPTGEDKIQPKDLTQFALTIAAGFGAVVALVVAYRRQLEMEQSRFVERFGAAASQLGSSDVAVRLAGVYAMTGVADRSTGHERQQSVDVLCGYLRLPYSTDTGSSHEYELVHKVPARGGKEEHEHHFRYRQGDKVVRQTILRVISAHLQGEARESWSGCDFDFTGAHLERVDFSSAIFNGEVVFSEVTFSGRTGFDHACFNGPFAIFDRASFTEFVSFVGTEFNGGGVFFQQAIFGEEGAYFNEAIFRGRTTTFLASTFMGGNVRFEEVAFASKETNFLLVDFKESSVDFSYPQQWDPPPMFDWAWARMAEGDRTKKPTNVKPDTWPPQVDSS